MELTAILLSRVLGLADTNELTPRGGPFFPEVVKELVHRYGFQKFPQTLDEWRSGEGGQFLVGKLGDTVVEKLVLYNDGFSVETRSGTTESKRILEEMLTWAQEKFGFAHGPSIIKRWAYVNDVVFRSDVPLLQIGPSATLSKGVSEALSKELGEEIVYEPINFALGHDPLTRKYGRVAFSIQRRAEVSFAENKYFSEAPLPTEIHLELLAKYEKDVAKMLNLP